MGAALGAITKDQLVEENLIMNMTMQGTKAKSSAAHIHEYKKWHATLVQLHVMMIMENVSLFVQGVHLVLMYETSRRVKDQYAVPYLVTVGEQQDNGQCMFFKTLDPH